MALMPTELLAASIRNFQGNCSTKTSHARQKPHFTTQHGLSPQTAQHIMSSHQMLLARLCILWNV